MRYWMHKAKCVHRQDIVKREDWLVDGNGVQHKLHKACTTPPSQQPKGISGAGAFTNFEAQSVKEILTKKRKWTLDLL
jgi:hypothetical protein